MKLPNLKITKSKKELLYAQANIMFIGVLSTLVLVGRWQQTPKITIFPSRHKEENVLRREI